MNVVERAESGDIEGSARQLLKSLRDGQAMGSKFVIVCADYHGAAGIFDTPEEAIDAAQVMSEGKCDYVPVAIFLAEDEARKFDA